MRVNITIDDFVYGWLKTHADSLNMPVNHLIRRAIYKELHDLNLKAQNEAITQALYKTGVDAGKHPLSSAVSKVRARFRYDKVKENAGDSETSRNAPRIIF